MKFEFFDSLTPEVAADFLGRTVEVWRDKI